MNFPHRLEMYMKQSVDEIEEYSNEVASLLQQKLGMLAIKMDLPIITAITKLRYASMFLRLLANMVIILFSTLSVIMLYNLLLVTVETKTYELGVLRILGLNAKGIIALVIT